MLVLLVREHEAVKIGENVLLWPEAQGATKLRLKISAPKDVRIQRVPRPQQSPRCDVCRHETPAAYLSPCRRCRRPLLCPTCHRDHACVPA